MPRPKSELTKNRRCVGFQLTPEQYEEWRRLGAQFWVRDLLKKSIEERKNAEKM